MEHSFEHFGPSRRESSSLDPTGSQGTGKVHDAYPLLCLSAYSPVVHTNKQRIMLWCQLCRTVVSILGSAITPVWLATGTGEIGTAHS